MIDEKNNGPVLYCRCEGRSFIPDSRKDEIQSLLESSGKSVTILTDLCGMAARKDPRLKAFADQEDTIAACYPRAVRWLFSSAGAPLRESVQLLNARKQSPEFILSCLTGDVNEAISGEIEKLSWTEDWQPWFPVIDYDRCKHCGQCASFCLFGVYDTDEHGVVHVSRPSNCKNNCPACARICPEAAIMFPKIDESPINGDEITDEESLRERIQVNIDHLLGDDIYAALAERRRKAAGLRLRRERLEMGESKQDRPVKTAGTARRTDASNNTASVE